MGSKKRLLRNSLLCVILDKSLLSGDRLFSTAKMAISSGADMLQLRGKGSSSKEMISDAIELMRLARNKSIPVIVNDRIDVAIASKCDGVHLGQSDMSIHTARSLLGDKKIIGISVSNFRQGLEASRRGADYLGAGPVFKTPIKASGIVCGLGLLKKLRAVRLPVLAIGGIDADNITALVAEGYRKIAVIRAICSSKDAAAATTKMKEAIS